MLGFVAVQLHVPELGVRDELAVEEERAADACAERQHHGQPGMSAARSEPHLRQPGGVGVVQHDDGTSHSGTEHLGGVRVDPGLVHVRGRPDHPVDDDAGERDAEGVRGVVPGDHLLDGDDHSLHRGRLRRRYAVPVGQQLTACRVDRCPFDA